MTDTTPGAPSALLLDFGGVLVSSTRPAGWEHQAAVQVEDLLGTHPQRPSAEQIAADLLAGETAAKQWRNAMSRPLYPAELDHLTYALDFVAAEWPDAMRARLATRASQLCYLVNAAAEIRTLRTGTVDLLRFSAAQGIPLVVVSNALSGAVHRDYLAEAGLSELFVAEIYSDEQGIRKPNPELLLRGAATTGVAPSDCWYVGDHLDRDVLCGRRAGIGTNVLMDDPGKAERPFDVGVREDVRVADPAELLTVLQDVMGRG